MIAAGSRTLIYNQDNRLSRVLENGEVLGEYVYNAFGQRVKKTTAAGVTVFLYDFDGNLIAEYQGSPWTSSLIAEYLYFGGNCLARTDGGGNVYFYYNDGLGTPRMVMDENNTVVWAAEHAPFGKAEVNVNSTITNNLRFPGQYYDQETGMHYNWHRYYDPETGRYISADPIGLAGGMNLYAYVENNPVNRIDPFGLATYRGVEGHYYVAGGGVMEVECCTENGKRRKHLYVKVCLGAALGVSGGGGNISNSDGKSCSNPPKNLLGGEIGASYGGGAEGSISVDTGGSGASASGGWDLGGKIGLSVKATACYYRLVNTIPSDKDCGCEN